MYKLGILGFILIVVATGMIARQAWYLTWPSVQAEVLDTQINARMTQDSRSGEEYPLYQPEIRFRYQRENGQSQLAKGTASFWSRDRNEAEKHLTPFHPGSRLEVRPDPKHPDRVRYDVAPISSSIHVLLYPLCFGVGLIIVAFLLHRVERRHAESSNGRT